MEPRLVDSLTISKWALLLPPDLQKLKELEPNWDSYGAKPIDIRCLDHAAYLMWMMPGCWTPVPCADGSVQLERHKGGMDMELRISVADSAREQS